MSDCCFQRMQVMVFSLMLGRHPCLPARHAVRFIFRVNLSHRMNPLTTIACMRLHESAPDILFNADIRYYCFVIPLSVIPRNNYKKPSSPVPQSGTWRSRL